MKDSMNGIEVGGYVTRRIRCSVDDIFKVVRLTKTQIVINHYGSEHKYNRNTGYPVGEYAVGSISRTIPPDIELLIGKKLRDKLHGIDWDSISISVKQMESIFNILGRDITEITALRELLK